MLQQRSDLKNLSQRSVLGCVAIASFFLLARIASAQVVISEIMYDPQGGDTNHEWVEVVNQGSTPVDLTQSKFVEGGSSHALVPVQGDTNLLSGAYAIIADNAQTFLNDHIGFSGAVFDSAFSLSNTGEIIAFKIPDGTVSDTVTYTSEQGGAGDGNSLQKVTSVWIGTSPTPGVENNNGANISSGSTSTTAASPSASVSDTADSFDTSLRTRITIQSGSTISGAPIIFLGDAVDSKKKPIDNAYYLWAFGDGETGSGKIVSHIFRYPGNYMVALDVSVGYGIPGVSQRMKILVSPALLRASPHASSSAAVDITNEGTKDIDLSSWVVEADYRRFTFPEHTMLLAGVTVTLASETTGFRSPLNFVRILYPNGTSYEEPQKEPAKEALVPASPSRAVKSASIAPTIRKTASAPSSQTASVVNAFDSATDSPSLPASNQEEGSIWPWYIGAAFFAALALLGLRLTRETQPSGTLTADDFEIIEDEEPH